MDTNFILTAMYTRCVRVRVCVCVSQMAHTTPPLKNLSHCGTKACILAFKK